MNITCKICSLSKILMLKPMTNVCTSRNNCISSTSFYSHVAVEARPMDPTKDLAQYGYGSIAWKERVESWKLRQGKLQMMMTEGGQLQASVQDENDLNGPDLPM